MLPALYIIAHAIITRHHSHKNALTTFNLNLSILYRQGDAISTRAPQGPGGMLFVPPTASLHRLLNDIPTDFAVRGFFCQPYNLLLNIDTKYKYI